MHAELQVQLSTIFGFLLVLARVSGIILFVPIPGIQSGPDAARIFLCFALSILLMPVWPAPAVDGMWFGRLPGWIAAEFTFGLMVGVAVVIVTEGFQMATQMIGLQAGYSFASTIDPNTQADSGILQIIAQLFSGVLFFALGFDREIVRVLAASLEQIPAVASLSSMPVMDAIVHLGSQMFVVGLRLALPVVALLILMDLSFALIGRVHSQFQLSSLTFAAKMLAGLGILATTMVMFPKLLNASAFHTFDVLLRLLGN